MKKLYEKNELLFAVLWIILYCAVTIPIRGKYGDGTCRHRSRYFRVCKRKSPGEKIWSLQMEGQGGRLLLFYPHADTDDRKSLGRIRRCLQWYLAGIRRYFHAAYRLY